MSGATGTESLGHSRGVSWLWRRQLGAYPETGTRILFLAITVLATITLYYELYVVGAVSTLVLADLHMSFTFFVLVLAFGNLIGAFGSLFAGLTDRLGRANLVVGGLILTGVFTAFIIPAATNKWFFAITSFVVGLVEGICLVATPALIRDFSPQVGRATAMGFWTTGPVVGSLVVAAVGSATIPAVVPDARIWTHQYLICGIAGLVVAAIALVGLRELSPQLRDQLMVTIRDRALVEARAKGLGELEIREALAHPFRQLLKPDIILSAVAVSVMLLIYYTAVGFALIYLTTVFGFSVKDANGLGNWNWGFNVIAVVLVGFVSDWFRVRKPFMIIGGGAAAVMTVVYLMQAGHHPGYYTLAITLAILSFALGVAYAPWMASFTENVEARNPALTATGLAIWGWILRVVVFIAFLIIPVVINSVTPLVDYGSQVSAYTAKYPSLVWAGTHPSLAADAKKYSAPLTFAAAHPTVVANATKYKVQLANAAKFAPELLVIQAHPALFTKLASYTNPATIPPALLVRAVAAAGGGAKGLAIVKTIGANKAPIDGVIAVAPQLKKIAPFSAQLTALAKVPPAVIAAVSAPGVSAQLKALAKVPPNVTAYMTAHASTVQSAAAKTVGQWKTWYWICFGGIIFFLLSIPLQRGRWRPRDARRDEEEHDAMMQAELARVRASS